MRQVTDAAGQVVGAIRYSPFGEILAQTGVTSPFGFTGEQQGSLNNLPSHCVASCGLSWTAVNFELLRQVHQQYRYVHNNPVNLTDPSGEGEELFIRMG